MPVPTIGDSATSNGTACFCMFEPISARFASSCSRKGISAVATLTICFGETSMKSTSVMGRSLKVWRVRHATCCDREMTFLVDRRVGLRDRVLVLLVRGEEHDVIADPRGPVRLLDDATERGLDEPELVDARERRERADEPDVRTFRGLDRADAAVVAVVHVAHVEPCALAGQPAWTKRREAALVGQLGERVGLVHELRELAGPEELLDRRDDRTRVDQARGRDRPRVADGHALLDDPLHADQAHAELVLQQLADGAHAAVAEVVDVVRLTVRRC